ncbi:alpha/beta hydrolase family protein [Corallococcus exercitus]|uniref:alpha/beta hydrolase family protein n=1 Tax=Corallococcus exercitus TaxID=2316736 RepID=UPI0035D3EE5A
MESWSPLRSHVVDVLFAGLARRARLFTDGWRRDGTFTSPLPHLTPPVQTAHVRWLSAERTRGRAACVVLAASREEGFALRERLYTPLVREGIDLFLLENPYYGVRRPPGQKGGALRTVSDRA